MKFYASFLCVALPCAQTSSTNLCVEAILSGDVLQQLQYMALSLIWKGVKREFWLSERREGRGRRLKAGKGKRIAVSYPNS